MYYLSFAWEFTLSSSLVGSLVCLITVLLFWPLVRRLLQINPSPVTSLLASLFHFLSPLSDAYTQAHTCIYNTPEQILFSNFLMVMWMKMPCFIQENILCTVMLTLFSSHILFSFTFLKVMSTTFVHFQVPLTISPISPLLIPFTCLKFCLHQKTVCYLRKYTQPCGLVHFAFMATNHKWESQYCQVLLPCYFNEFAFALSNLAASCLSYHPTSPIQTSQSLHLSNLPL